MPASGIVARTCCLPCVLVVFTSASTTIKLPSADRHATLAAALAIMTIEAFPGRRAIWAAAALEAVCSPFVPTPSCFCRRWPLQSPSGRGCARTGSEWAIALVLFTALGFAPLVAQGILDDLVRGPRGGVWRSVQPCLFLRGGRDHCPRTEFSSYSPHARMPDRALGLRAVFSGSLVTDVVAGSRGRTRLPSAAPGSARLPGESSGLDRVDFPGRTGLPGSRASPALPGPCDFWRFVSFLVKQSPKFPHFAYRLRVSGPWAVPCARPAGRSASGLPGPLVPAEVLPPLLDLLLPGTCDLRRTTTSDTEIANVLKQTPYPSFNGPPGRRSPFRSESGICWMLLVDMDLDDEFAREAGVIAWHRGGLVTAKSASIRL